MQDRCLDRVRGIATRGDTAASAIDDPISHNHPRSHQCPSLVDRRAGQRDEPPGLMQHEGGREPHDLPPVGRQLCVPETVVDEGGTDLVVLVPVDLDPQPESGQADVEEDDPLGEGHAQVADPAVDARVREGGVRGPLGR